ncbi:hypothetical protein BGZ74_009360 [Mortierella antarctica]|nr:hypothetical protein BGZ74_009360 [Mortierella antarctica]
MNLESGAGGLTNLKGLRLLDVSNMRHHMTDADRERMRANWPNLEELQEQSPYDDVERNRQYGMLGELEKEPYDSEEEAGSAIDVGRDEGPGSVEDDDEWEADSTEEEDCLSNVLE